MKSLEERSRALLRDMGDNNPYMSARLQLVMSHLRDDEQVRKLVDMFDKFLGTANEVKRSNTYEFMKYLQTRIHECDTFLTENFK